MGLQLVVCLSAHLCRRLFSRVLRICGSASFPSSPAGSSHHGRPGAASGDLHSTTAVARSADRTLGAGRDRRHAAGTGDDVTREQRRGIRAEPRVEGSRGEPGPRRRTEHFLRGCVAAVALSIGLKVFFSHVHAEVSWFVALCTRLALLHTIGRLLQFFFSGNFPTFSPFFFLCAAHGL